MPGGRGTCPKRPRPLLLCGGLHHTPPVSFPAGGTMELAEYIDAAKRRLNTTSNRELSREIARRLGKPQDKTNIVAMWVSARAWPSDDAMIVLCEIADLDARAGLFAVSQWRNKGRAATVWAEIRTMFAMLALPLFLFFAPAHKGETISVFAPICAVAVRRKAEVPGAPSVYYGKYSVRKTMRFFRNLARGVRCGRSKRVRCAHCPYSAQQPPARRNCVTMSGPAAWPGVHRRPPGSIPAGRRRVRKTRRT